MRRPPGHELGLPSRPTPTLRAARPVVTSEAGVVVSGPNLSDFDRAPAQSRQDQTLAQEVAARVAEGVRLGRHVHALCNGAGGRGEATSDRRGYRGDGGDGDSDSGSGGPGSLPQPRSPRRVHVVWNRKGERRYTGSEGSGAEPVTASPPPGPAGGGPSTGPLRYWLVQDQGGARGAPL